MWIDDLPEGLHAAPLSSAAADDAAMDDVFPEMPASSGFPSPATDFREARLSLDEHLGIHRSATFLMRARGRLMTDFGIHDGDLLVVDRALRPAHQSIVIAVVDGGLAVRQLRQTASGPRLCTGRMAGSGGLRDHGRPLENGPETPSGNWSEIWGVVRWCLHRVGQ